MSGKAVSSSGNTGPRDFSGQVHANFTGPAPVAAITAQIFLDDGDLGKLDVGDVLAALTELLAREGVEGKVDVRASGEVP